MKLYSLAILLLFSIILNAQDEYEKKETEKILEPIDSKTDSIDVSVNKDKKEKESDNSKAYKGMSDFKRNIRIGGAFNLGSYYYEDRSIPFSGQLFFIQVSPQLTYVMSPHFEGGISTSYTYTGSFGDINSHSISAGPILRAYPFPEMFLQVEGVGFYNTIKAKGYVPYTTFNFNAFVGGGIVSRFSQTTYLITGIKVNLMKNELTYNQIIPTAFTSIHFGLW